VRKGNKRIKQEEKEWLEDKKAEEKALKKYQGRQ